MYVIIFICFCKLFYLFIIDTFGTLRSIAQSMQSQAQVPESPVKNTIPPVNFIEFSSFVEMFKGPTGETTSQNIIHIKDILKEETYDVYDYRKLVSHFSNISEVISKKGKNAFVIEIPVIILSMLYYFINIFRN